MCQCEFDIQIADNIFHQQSFYDPVTDINFDDLIVEIDYPLNHNFSIPMAPIVQQNDGENVPYQLCPEENTQTEEKMIQNCDFCPNFVHGAEYMNLFARIMLEQNPEYQADVANILNIQKCCNPSIEDSLKRICGK